MNSNFIFSKNHLIILLIFALFLYFCPKLTKNLLPYSYLVEKLICILIILGLILEQCFLIYTHQYSVLNTLPIDIIRFTEYVCIAILFFKQYQLFNIYFSWSLVCSIGSIIFFKYISSDFPNFLYFEYLFSNIIIIYTNVYLVQVRKFKINRSAIKDNLISCLTYFSFIFLLNKILGTNYTYIFSSSNILSILIFTTITTLLYLPYYFFKSDKSSFN